jgi:hypothetical protein
LERSFNLVLQRAGGLLKYGNAATIEQADTWATGNDADTHTQFGVLPAGPGTTISDADVTAALTYLDTFKPTSVRFAHVAGAARSVPVYAPWRP